VDALALTSDERRDQAAIRFGEVVDALALTSDERRDQAAIRFGEVPNYLRSGDF
jgi:hypothetical protein